MTEQELGVWSEQVPSRANVAWVYAKRIARWRRNSYPYITGDLFSDKADVSVYPPKWRGRMPSAREIKSANVIFCPSNNLDTFLEEYRKKLSAKVIICGNSDFEFHHLPKNIPSSVRQLFLQNSFISTHPLVSTLPIGIENLRWGVNGNPKFVKKTRDWSSRKSKILVGPFGLTHALRTDLLHQLRDDSNLDFIELRLSPSRYATLSNDYKYVAAVRGNGVDTHRFWESLYRGSIPVVLKDAWSSSLKGLSLPFIELDGWNSPEIQRALEDQPQSEFDPKGLDALWWPYWQQQIGKYV